MECSRCDWLQHLPSEFSIKSKPLRDWLTPRQVEFFYIWFTVLARFAEIQSSPVNMVMSLKYWSSWKHMESMHYIQFLGFFSCLYKSNVIDKKHTQKKQKTFQGASFPKWSAFDHTYVSERACVCVCVSCRICIWALMSLLLLFFPQFSPGQVRSG